MAEDFLAVGIAAVVATESCYRAEGVRMALTFIPRRRGDDQHRLEKQGVTRRFRAIEGIRPALVGC